MDEVYITDAYHSLSIEGYRVSPELIERVRSGSWNPHELADDRAARDALAASGYWQAFQAVKADVAAVIGGADAGKLVSDTHRVCYRELFQPCVAAGLIPTEALAGYRNDAVYIRNANHVPPRWQAVRDAMPTLFRSISKEKHSAARAVLGHWAIRLHSSLFRRQWPNRPLLDECSHGVRRISVDGHSRRGSSPLPGRAGERERR